jgi:cytochrome P450
MSREAPAQAHVAPGAIVDYDYMDGPEIKRHPPSCVDSFREDHRAMYSRLYGGAWILTRFDDIRAVFIDSEHFLQWPDGVPPTPYGAVDIPGHLNPPLHTSYRRLLAPLWSPRRIERLEADVRAVAQGRLRELAPQGRCEFRRDFAIRLPAAMFCSLFGLPLDDFSTFESMAADTVYGPARARRVEGEEGAKRVRAQITKTIRRFMADLLEERRADRGEDLISFLLDAKLDGDRGLTDDEIVNIAGFFFRAGTDSTAGAITYAFSYLEQHAGLRQQLIDDPSIAENAATELIRLTAFITLPVWQCPTSRLPESRCGRATSSCCRRAARTTTTARSRIQ